METDFVAYIGIDWADRKHDICLYDVTTGEREYSVIGATPQAIADWVNSLQAALWQCPHCRLSRTEARVFNLRSVPVREPGIVSH